MLWIHYSLHHITLDSELSLRLETLVFEFLKINNKNCFLLRPNLNCRIFALQRLSLNKGINHNRLKLRNLIILLFVTTLLLSEETAFANRRHFSYTYESA